MGGESLGLPAVVMGSHPAEPGRTPSVWIDDAVVTTQLLEYLWALGHRRLAHVAGPGAYEHTARRTAALDDFARARGLDDAETITTDFSAADGADATRHLLSRPHPPTAIVYDSDVLAVAGLGVAQEMGVAVPAELSIVSFDDSVMARLVRPALTTLTRDTVEFAEAAVGLLLRQIDASEPLPSEPGPRVTLTVRDSTAPPARR